MAIMRHGLPQGAIALTAVAALMLGTLGPVSASTTGSRPCGRGTPVVTASPTSMVVPRGGRSTATIVVRNADYGGCAASTFTFRLTATLSGYGSAAITGAGSVTVAAASTGYTTLTVTMPTSARIGLKGAVIVFASRTTTPTAGYVIIPVTLN
jgi:hypothetical protein